MNLTRQQLAGQTLELTVWDYDRFKTHDFLGEVSLNMSGNELALRVRRIFILVLLQLTVHSSCFVEK